MWILTTISGHVGLFIATVVFASTVFLVAMIDRTGRFWWPIGRLWGKTIYWGAWSRVHARGFDQLAWNQPAVLMANHESYLDVPALIASSPVPLRFVSRKEVFNAPILGQAMWMTGQISLDRSNKDRAIQSLSLAASRVAKGCTVVVFPEGTRSAQGDLQGFKKGGFMLALESGAPIIPVGLSGTRNVVPRGSWRFHAARVGIVLGDPIPTENLTLDDRDWLMQRVKSEIELAQKRARQMG
jgi:1-acyl-sn-glycerol-3-phosphate acyltransferase